MADRHEMIILDRLAKKQLQIQHRRDMHQRAKVNELERKVNTKRASLTEQGREIDLAKNRGFISLTTGKTTLGFRA